MRPVMETTPVELFQSFALAILLGALMGLERERSGGRLAGMRTFPLISLLGAVFAHIALLSGSMFVLGAGLVGMTILVGVANMVQGRSRPDPGLTTEMAMLVAFGTGALVVFEQTLLAIAVAFAATAILYFKPHLHAFSRKVEARDLYAVFQFGLVSFIILPILPDRTYGPYDALNPHHIWLMVVLISGMSLVGYVIMKIIGNRWGGPVMGILGGIVSSTATTLAFGRRARKDNGFSRTAAVIIVMAAAMVMVRVTVEVAVIHPSLLRDIGVPILCMFLAGLMAGGLVWRRSRREETHVPETKNPAELSGALLFGILYGLILLITSAAEDYFGSGGVYIVSIISGLVGVDAITLTSARLTAQGLLDPLQARNAILLAILSNLAFKLAIVHLLGTRSLTRWTAAGFAAIAAGALVVFLFRT